MKYKGLFLRNKSLGRAVGFRVSLWGKKTLGLMDFFKAT